MGEKMLKITNARVFWRGQFIEREVGIEEGDITEIGNVVEADETIDAKGQWLLPGLIDPHAHLREPGATHKEDFLTGSKAAIAGGFTSVMDMPNNHPPTTTLERLDEKQALARKAKCEVFFHFGADGNNFAEVQKTNPGSLKLYMGETTGRMQLPDAAVERYFAEFDKKKPIVVHAEGKKIKKAVELAKRYDRRIHLAHAPTRGAVEQAKTWKEATVEVTPHHLFLSSRYALKHPEVGAVKPPLQTERERKALWDVLAEVDCIASDHAPHTLEEKAKGAYGFPGLETTLALMLEVYYQKRVPFRWLMERMAENPARIFGLQKHGAIEKGYFANLILVDLKKEWVVRGEELETKCGWSPFEGRKMRGKTTMAVVHGKIVYDQGEFK